KIFAEDDYNVSSIFAKPKNESNRESGTEEDKILKEFFGGLCDLDLLRAEKMTQCCNLTTYLRAFHIEDISRNRHPMYDPLLHQAIVQVLMQKLSGRTEYEVALMRIEAASQSQYLHLEQRAQGEGLNIAREYGKPTNELNEKARANLHLRASYSSAKSTQVANRLKLVQDEEQAARSEARLEIHAAEVNKYTAQNDAWRDRMTNEAAHQQFINQLHKEFRIGSIHESMAVQRMEEARLPHDYVFSKFNSADDSLYQLCTRNPALPLRLAQPNATEVAVLPEEIAFPLKAGYERMNETFHGLKDNVDLGGRGLRDLHGNDRPPGDEYDDDDDDDDDKPPGGKPPPEPGEGEELEYYPDPEPGGDLPIGALVDDRAIDDIGDKILARAAARQPFRFEDVQSEQASSSGKDPGGNVDNEQIKAWASFRVLGCQHVAADKIQKFPFLAEYFADVSVVRHGTNFAVTEADTEKNGVRLSVSTPAIDMIQAQNQNFFNAAYVINNMEVPYVQFRITRTVGWYKINQDYYSKMPGTATQGLRACQLIALPGRFLYKGNPPPIINNVHDVAALLRTLPPGIEHPLAFAMNSLQAFSVALHVLHRYVNYKDYEGTSLYQWSTFERPEYGMTVHDYLSVHIEKAPSELARSGLSKPPLLRAADLLINHNRKTNLQQHVSKLLFRKVLWSIHLSPRKALHGARLPSWKQRDNLMSILKVTVRL
ncbi:ascc3, partial [Symbiodinium microadriaticum]